MLFKIDTLFGHVIEETAEGAVVYQDDRSPVDFANPRACLGCAKRVGHGEHDPCIAGLPGTRNACCGHGREHSARGQSPAGYVALEDGRTFRFSGLQPADKIHAAVAAALKGDDLPDGFEYDAEQAWWAGLTEAQKDYVQTRIVNALSELVRAVTGAEPNPGIIDGSTMWYEGLSQEHKDTVWSRLPESLNQLREEALALA